jgi:hypothetical protein
MQSGNYSAEWLNFKKSDEQFVRDRAKFFASDMEAQLSDLRLSLKGDRNDTLVALNFMVGHGPKYPALIDTLLEVAIAGGEIQSAHAINIVGYYKDLLRDGILLFVRNFLKTNKADYFTYGNIHGLLYDLDYQEERKHFIENYCATSSDPEIQELYRDFMLDE